MFLGSDVLCSGVFGFSWFFAQVFFALKIFVRYLDKGPVLMFSLKCFLRSATDKNVGLCTNLRHGSGLLYGNAAASCCEAMSLFGETTSPLCKVVPHPLSKAMLYYARRCFIMKSDCSTLQGDILFGKVIPHSKHLFLRKRVGQTHSKRLFLKKRVG